MAFRAIDEDDNESWSEKGVSTYCAETYDVELGQQIDKSVLWRETVRHAILLLRLQRPYLLYCLCCAALACAAFLSTMFDLITSHHQGVLGNGRDWIDVLEGGTWQSTCWTLVGLALVAEVLCSAVTRRGGGVCTGDWWCAFDALLVALTLLGWMLTHFRRVTPMREEAEQMDLWLLLMRFILQPCRVFAAASMARKVQQMQQSYTDVSFDALGPAAASKASDPAIIEACVHKGQHML